MNGVHSVRRIDERNPIYEARLDEGADVHKTLGDIASGMPIRRVELRKATLEDIFVSLVDPGDSEDSIRAALTSNTAQPVEA